MEKQNNELAQISFFLGRENITFNTIIDPEINLASHSKLRIEDFVEDDVPCRFIYYETTSMKVNPPWLNFANEKIDAKNPILFSAKSESPNGILLMEIDKRVIAASFGRSAGSCLHNKALEADFGIKTAMNMCGNEEIRQTKSQSHAITTTFIDRQVARPSDSFSFGLSEAEDLRYISAHLKGESNITLQGRNNLTIKVLGNEKLNWSRLIQKCRKFLKEYESKAYLDLFPNYKNFRPASDDEIQELDKDLVDRLRAEDFKKIQLCIPEFMSDDDYSFSYSNNPKKENIIYSFLETGQLKAIFDLKAVSIKDLENKKIFAYSHAENRILSYKKWPVYDCLVYECGMAGKYFILSDGRWSQVDNEFYSSVTGFIDNTLQEEPCEDIYKNINIFDPKSGKNQESIFNDEVCKIRPSNIKFDRAKLKIGTGKKDKEFCDVLDMQDNNKIRIIHCKPYSGASSINYLFAQAKFYGEAFLNDDVFLGEIREHISKSTSPKKQAYLDYIKPSVPDLSGHEYRVCLWLLYDKKDPVPTKKDIPLISQYELKLMHDHLRRTCKFNEIVLRFVPVGITPFKAAKAATKTTK